MYTDGPKTATQQQQQLKWSFLVQLCSVIMCRQAKHGIPQLLLLSLICVMIANSIQFYSLSLAAVRSTAELLQLTLLHSEWPKLQRVLAILNAIGLKEAEFAAATQCYTIMTSQLFYLYPVPSRTISRTHPATLLHHSLHPPTLHLLSLLLGIVDTMAFHLYSC